jgi:F-box protein 21
MILIAQWCQPVANIQEESIKQALDQLAARIREQLPSGLLQADGRAAAADVSSCRKILDTANAVFQLEGYVGNTEDYYAPQNSYINRVLETRMGIPITLSLIYACVLARVGVICQPVNFPSHFLLRWLEHPEARTEQGGNAVQNCSNVAELQFRESLNFLKFLLPANSKLL